MFECNLCLFLFFHRTSEVMYEVLDESLRRAEMNHNITYGKFLNKDGVWQTILLSLTLDAQLFTFTAILYEGVKCVYTIHPKSELLEKAAKCIGNFVLSPKINLKYLGKNGQIM